MVKPLLMASSFLVLAFAQSALAGAPAASTAINTLPTTTQVLLHNTFAVPARTTPNMYYTTFYYQGAARVTYASLNRIKPYCVFMVKPLIGQTLTLAPNTTYTLLIDSTNQYYFYLKGVTAAGVQCTNFGHPTTVGDIAAAFGNDITLNLP